MAMKNVKGESQGGATGPGPGGWSRGSNVSAPQGHRGDEIKALSTGKAYSSVKPSYESSDMRPGSKGK